jgi:RNA polymerase sigma factor (sigma-70 family)
MKPEMTIPQIAEKIYRDHYPALLERAVKMCGGNMELAKDCVMDIFRSFIENEWQIQKENRLNYFLVAVTRLCIDRLVSERKREMRWRVYHENDEAVFAPPILQDKSLIDRVRSFLSSPELKPNERTVLSLLIDGYGAKEISQTLNFTEDMFYSNKTRGVKKIKQLLKQ